MCACVCVTVEILLVMHSLHAYIRQSSVRGMEERGGGASLTVIEGICWKTQKNSSEPREEVSGAQVVSADRTRKSPFVLDLLNS